MSDGDPSSRDDRAGEGTVVELADATWPDADAASVDVAVLPVGSTEQHGPHAPLGTDRVAAEAVAAAGAEAYDGTVVLAPSVSVGVSEEHRRFAGTLWVSPETFRGYVRDVLGSLASHGWDRVVVVNGHGGNVDALREVCATSSRHDAVYAVPFTWFEAVDGDGPAFGHAGGAETALLRAVRPDLVREDRVADARAGASDHWGEWVRGVNLAYDTDEFAENGVVGDPEAGDADRGEELLAAAAAALADLLDAVATRDLPDRT